MPKWIKVAVAVYLAIGVLITIIMAKYPSPIYINGFPIHKEPRTMTEVIEVLSQNPLIVVTGVLLWPALL